MLSREEIQEGIEHGFVELRLFSFADGTCWQHSRDGDGADENRNDVASAGEVHPRRRRKLLHALCAIASVDRVGESDGSGGGAFERRRQNQRRLLARDERADVAGRS